VGQQRFGGGGRVGRAGADRGDAVVGFDDVAFTREDQD
jgi:hypothetical protein